MADPDRPRHGLLCYTSGKLKMPKNLTIILLPSRSPELNPVENIWQYMRANWLAIRGSGGATVINGQRRAR